MSKTPQAVRGTQDIFGDEAEAFRHVVDTFERVRRLYRFRRVEMPVFERTEVFARSLGETTDVVSKEMYSFDDRGGESLTLRPEFTAGIARAFLTDGWRQHVPLKLATHGPCFRYERPQKGRFRQFHQLDAEVIGASEPQADVELIAFADQLLRELGIEGVTCRLNTLGDAESREAWRAALVAHFGAVRGELSAESQARLDVNPLRILDSKAREDRPHVEAAPEIDAFLSDEANAFFEAVGAGLDAAGVRWERDRALVRGLDYYRHTAFEFVPDAGSAAAETLGAQSTVLGGGRYDGLFEALGGPETPAVGWAAGIERLAMLVERAEPVADVAVVVEDDAALAEATLAIGRLRRAGLACDLVATGSPRKRFDKAVKSGARAIVAFDADGRRVKAEDALAKRIEETLA